VKKIEKIEDKLIKEIGININENIFSKRIKSGYNIFLIGKGTKNNDSIRNKLREEIIRKRVLYNWFDIYYPEYLFEELLGPGSKFNLLELENKLAEWVHCVVIILESAGAIAELGAFSNHIDLRNKLIVVVNERHNKNKSFIVLGPIKFLKSNTKSKIIVEDYNNINMDSLGDKIRRHVREIAKGVELDESISNPIEAQHFLRVAIYLMSPVPRETLISLMMSMKDIPHEEANKIITTALNILNKDGYIKIKNTNISLSKDGISRLLYTLRKDYNDKHIFNTLDSIRTNFLNKFMRKKGNRYFVIGRAVNSE